ncbi:DUF4198 domain-containing protein [Cohaesibacter celericrescens]|uniref:DUF4198 domain-containing protein n=1 Tax=Cohaesibacter celericrescens TaxID=2067669 RepID=A0A2N5XQ13_9HYPH|nr:DUF4198 domain-containing protein [Cohaesibacter celericrescens]PLW76616.1 DUF4198 domain-containing protein [Cohaesibacter celericrescens]
MKKLLAGAAIATIALSGAAQAHFQLLYTPDVMLDSAQEIPLKLMFGHPMENGHAMDMGSPEAFDVYFKGKKTDLLPTLDPIIWKGAHNEAKGFETTYKIKRNGDYIFALTPAPYYESSEDIYIQQITKSFVNKAMPVDWAEPLGLKTEILPLNKPYQNFVGGTFTGKLLSSGKPKGGIECEIEYINPKIDLKGNAFAKEADGPVPDSAIVAITDDNGVFTFGLPRAGSWGFACLGAGPDTEFDGKELSQDAVLWIDVKEFK